MRTLITVIDLLANLATLAAAFPDWSLLILLVGAVTCCASYLLERHKRRDK
jgi:hypothetical protein